MTDETRTDKTFQCDRCDKFGEAKFVKRAASAPQLWGKNAKAASLGTFCSLTCAEAEPTASREAVAYIVEGVVRAGTIKLWQRLIEVYPAPVAIEAEVEKWWLAAALGR